MKLGIYTIEKTLYEGEVKEIIAKTSTGEISIFENHIPLISKIAIGPLRVKEISGAEKSIAMGSGFIEIQPENSVVVLIDTA